MNLKQTIAVEPLLRHSGHMPLKTYPDRATLGYGAAADIANALRSRLQVQERVRMVFAAAPSQASMLQVLALDPSIDWNRITAFHMDEYIGLPEAAPERFAQWLKAHLFDRVPLAEVHLLVPEPDPAAEARRYASLLAEAPIDFVCLGIGVNGHIAFNDPPVADFNDPQDVKVVELDALCRQQQVDDKCFDSIGDVPSHALTLTIPRLLRADQLFCVVPGSAKRSAVDAALNGDVSISSPASILRTHPNCTFYLDKESDPDA